MKFIIMCFAFILSACNSKSTFNPASVVNRPSQSSEEKYKSKIVYETQKLKINKIVLCNQEILAEKLVVLDREHESLIEGNDLRLFKSIKIDFNEIYKLKNIDFNVCSSLVVEGNFDKGLGEIFLGGEAESNERYLISKTYGLSGVNPLKARLIFEISNPKFFHSKILIDGRLNLFSNKTVFQIQSNQKYAFIDGTVFEEKIDFKSLVEFESLCLEKKCGNFLKIESFISNNDFRKEKIWIAYKNNLFWGTSDEIINYLSNEKSFSITDIHQKEFKKPFAASFHLQMTADKVIIQAKEGRISTSWTEQSCHYDHPDRPDRNRNKERVCYDQKKEGIVNYLVNEVQSFEKINLMENNFDNVLPVFRNIEDKFDKCKKEFTNGVQIFCSNMLSDSLLLEKLLLLPEYFSIENPKVFTGLERILSNEGAGKNNFSYNYALPEKKEENIYKNIDFVGWVTIKTLNKKISEELYQN